MAIVTDAVPPARRGRAMGAVMGAFAVASVLGVPVGLELARLGGWRMPFLTVAALGAVVIAIATRLLPAQRAHLALDRIGRPAPFREVLSRPVVQLSLSCTAVAIIANFALIPNLSTYFQLNLGYPREQLSLLYMVGGVVSFATLRLAGRLVDRHGSPIVAAGGGLGFIVVLVIGFIHPVAWVPVLPIFVGFMVSGSFRNVSMQALSSRVPGPGERARFLSAQSAVQHLAASAGAIAGSRLLDERAGGALIGMERLAWFAIATAILLPILLVLVHRRVRAAELADPPGTG
jgi:predicted MFS family arabinose efflux permease